MASAVWKQKILTGRQGFTGLTQTRFPIADKDGVKLGNHLILLFRNPPNDFVSKFSAPAGCPSVPARLCKWRFGSRNALAGHIVFESAPAKHLGISRNNRLVFLHVSSPFYILWCGWACFICMKTVGWACLSACLFLFVG